LNLLDCFLENPMNYLYHHLYHSLQAARVHIYIIHSKVHYSTTGMFLCWKYELRWQMKTVLVVDYYDSPWSACEGKTMIAWIDWTAVIWYMRRVPPEL
jgi:hypothetical protein